ncbi:MAG: hypothetical protein NTY51_00415 [Deltaproteobacteria bacterium]|jgi:hypothetical protein|nr:hypothetical protein [Deltaproteobacteria bacterium]
MKKFFIALVVFLSLNAVSNSFAFLDYLFSGSSSRDAIDNSAVGDLRAWWTGNPAYTFNPYYSGQQPQAPQGQQQAGQAPQVMQPQLQQPTINYYPPSQGGSSYQYGPQQYPAQQMPQQAPQQQMQYGQPQQQFYQPQQQQTYQPQPQGMQAAPPQYQMGPQSNQYQGNQQ